MEKVSMNSAHK